tara:strand:+ start:73 stop:315 length:243 start_codon:yes stop_codon:yes gene_type:complete
MEENKKEMSVVYLGSNEINETIQMIEKDGWNAGELLYDDLKDFRRAVGSGTDTFGDYEYLRDFLTYLINRKDYWKGENEE